MTTSFGSYQSLDLCGHFKMRMTEASQKRKCKFESRDNIVTLENLFDFKFIYIWVCITQKGNDLHGLQASYK